MKPFPHRLALLFLAGVLTLAGMPTTDAKDSKGYLFIIGGGRQPAEMTKRFVELAGGESKARIVVIPMASESPAKSGEYQVAEFKSQGVVNVESVVLTREEATNRAAAARLNDATGVFFTGGDQSRLAAVIVDSPVHQRLKELYAQGAVMGGTSAGAAVMSKVMITGEELLNDDKTNAFKFIKRNNIQTIEGFGFLTNAVIDQHFIKRKRLNRLFSIALEHPNLVGIGIDESTAIVVNPDDTFEVIGESAVMVIDPRKANGIRTDKSGNLSARNIQTHILVAGDRFDVTSGKTVEQGNSP
jgi:cyanophycinase